MSFTIHKNLTHETLASRLPRAMVECVPPASDLPQQFDLIVFTARVVKSAEIDKSLKRRDKESDRSDIPVLFVAENFTEDCRMLAEGRPCIFASVRYFDWTDRRYEFIRTISASKVKTPDVREREKERSMGEQDGGGGGPAAAPPGSA